MGVRYRNATRLASALQHGSNNPLNSSLCGAFNRSVTRSPAATHLVLSPGLSNQDFQSLSREITCCNPPDIQCQTSRMLHYSGTFKESHFTRSFPRKTPWIKHIWILVAKSKTMLVLKLHAFILNGKMNFVTSTKYG